MIIGLHVGCGPIKLPATGPVRWVNIDIEPSHQPEICMDCLDILERFGSNAFNFISTCHHLEHLKYPTDVGSFLRQCHDVLKPGGVLRVAVPDLELVAKAYASGSDMRFIYGPVFKGYYHVPHSKAERFQFWAREWSHTVLFDADLLSYWLEVAGFRRILRREFNQTDIPGFTFDRFQSESLYMEATKA